MVFHAFTCSIKVKAQRSDKMSGAFEKLKFEKKLKWRVMCVCKYLSHIQLFATPWIVACQALLSIEFSRQEYWSVLPFKVRQCLFKNLGQNIPSRSCYKWKYFEAGNCLPYLRNRKKAEVAGVEYAVVYLLSHVQLSATLYTVCNPPGSNVHGISQARILEWVVIPSSRGSFQPRDQTIFSFGRWVLYHWAIRKPLEYIVYIYIYVLYIYKTG